MIAARAPIGETTMPSSGVSYAQVGPLLAWLCICAASAGMAYATVAWAGV